MDFQMEQLLDKELAGWSYSKRCSQHAKWEPVATAVPQGPALGPPMFKISVSDIVGSRAPSASLSLAPNCVMPGGKGCHSEGEVERWACVNLMKFSKTKYQVLNLSWGNPKYKLGGEWIMKRTALGCLW